MTNLTATSNVDLDPEGSGLTIKTLRASATDPEMNPEGFMTEREAREALANQSRGIIERWLSAAEDFTARNTDLLKLAAGTYATLYELRNLKYANIIESAPIGAALNTANSAAMIGGFRDEPTPESDTYISRVLLADENSFVGFSKLMLEASDALLKASMREGLINSNDAERLVTGIRQGLTTLRGELNPN